MGNDKNGGSFNPLNMSALTRDAFRSLRMNISFSGGDKDVKTLVVSSAVPNEGKTSVAIALGISMAESMKNTLLIECDCRRPSIGNRLKLRPASNWIDVIYQHVQLQDAIVPTNCPNLYFLDAEPGLVHSVELLSSGRFWEMIELLKEQFDFIILDTPPLGSFIDAAVLGERSDGTILVVNSGSREVRLHKETAAQLKKANARVLGVVLNRINAHQSSYYRYGDYYYREHNQSPGYEKRRQNEKTATASKSKSQATYRPGTGEKGRAATGTEYNEK